MSIGRDVSTKAASRVRTLRCSNLRGQCLAASVRPNRGSSGRKKLPRSTFNVVRTSLDLKLTTIATVCAYRYMSPIPQILSISDVAAVLRCSKAHVCKAIGGKVAGVTPLPAISMGRRKLVRRQSLEAWLAQNDPASTDAILDQSHNGLP